MSGFKDIADVADRLIYEVIALLLPGALFALMVVAVLGPEIAGSGAWDGALDFAGSHEILAGAIAYSLGYVIQGLSRPVSHRLDAGLRWIWHSADRPRSWVRLRGVAARRWIEREVFRWPEGSALNRGTHAHATSVTLEELAARRLAKQLGLNKRVRLTSREVQDLAFSVLSSDIKRLERFRAAASCVRAVATVIAIGWLAMVAEMILGLFSRAGWPFTWWSVSVLAAAIAAFEALMSRERMYEATWRSVIAPQFLIATSQKRDRAEV